MVKRLLVTNGEVIHTYIHTCCYY